MDTLSQWHFNPPYILHIWYIPPETHPCKVSSHSGSVWFFLGVKHMVRGEVSNKCDFFLTQKSQCWKFSYQLRFVWQTHSHQFRNHSFVRRPLIMKHMTKHTLTEGESLVRQVTCNSSYGQKLFYKAVKERWSVFSNSLSVSWLLF